MEQRKRLMIMTSHNYKVFIIELQIKATAGGKNYNYHYCTRKTVIIT